MLRFSARNSPCSARLSVAALCCANRFLMLRRRPGPASKAKRLDSSWKPCGNSRQATWPVSCANASSGNCALKRARTCCICTSADTPTGRPCLNSDHNCMAPVPWRTRYGNSTHGFQAAILVEPRLAYKLPAHCSQCSKEVPTKSPRKSKVEANVWGAVATKPKRCRLPLFTRRRPTSVNTRGGASRTLSRHSTSA